MATETEKLYNETATQTGAGTGTTATTPTSTAAATSPYVTGNTALDNYNNTRYNQINSMYDAQRTNALNQLETAHNRNMADAQAAYDKITPAYQEARNSSGAEYERQRRNNNLQAQANGLNTGANSQMQLAASNVYQTNQAQLEKAEKDALAEAERQQLTMKQQYEADVADALSKNDAERAAALLNEYGQQYDRMQSEAKTLAAYGDFSLYKELYGEAAATQMEQAWLLQNPQLAYAMGRITPEQYFSMTGKWPAGYDTGSTAGYGGSGRGYSGGSSGGGESYNLTKADLYGLEATGASETDIKNFINAYAGNKEEAQALYSDVMKGQLAAGEAMWNRGSDNTGKGKASSSSTTTTPVNKPSKTTAQDDYLKIANSGYAS